MKKLTVSIIGLGGRGLDVYAPIVSKYPETMQLVAVADIRNERLEKARREFHLNDSMCFTSAEELLKQDRLSDVLFICTLDQQHIGHAITALEKGYDLLLEKPISADAQACMHLLEEAEKRSRKVCVCHVLRYTPFYGKLKELLSSKTIGKVISIQAREEVGYYHYAHSFVRGNWRNSNTTSPMILQKCCHDMDLFVWLADSKCKKISSFGSLTWFREENAPKGAPEMCMGGCSSKESCPYDCEKIYITNPKTGIHSGNSWPADVVVTDPTEEKLREALKTSPYGRCVYHCDNNVVDHQQVTMIMENDVLVSLSMCAFGDIVNRTIKIMGTEGEIEGDLTKELITIRIFGGEEQVIDLHDLVEDFSHHSGGDERMVKQFTDYILHDITTDAITSLEKSIESHLMGIAAEESRLNDGKTIYLH